MCKIRRIFTLLQKFRRLVVRLERHTDSRPDIACSGCDCRAVKELGLSRQDEKMQGTIALAAVLRKKFLVVNMLLVLLLGAMLVVPSGMDLEVCLGEDGNVDFLLNGCARRVLTPTPVKQLSLSHDTTLHGECLDVVVVCGTAPELLRPADTPDTCRSELRENTFRAPFVLPADAAGSVGTYLVGNDHSVSSVDSFSSTIVFLRTTILLI